jgi:hypothetical protein
VAVAVQGEVDRGVPRAHGDLLGRRAGGDPQRHGGVAKVVDAQALQAGCPGSRHPKRARKPGTRSPLPTAGGEDVAAGRCPAARCASSSRTTNGSPTVRRRRASWGAGDQLALDLGEDLGHGDRLGQQIVPARAEPGQLADPQAAVGADEHQRPVAGMNGLSQVDDLGGVRKRISSRLILGSGTLGQGLCTRIPGAGRSSCPLPAAIRRGMDPRRPAGGPHSAELGRDGEHSWTKSGTAGRPASRRRLSQLDLAVSTDDASPFCAGGDVPRYRYIPGTG